MSLNRALLALGVTTLLFAVSACDDQSRGSEGDPCDEKAPCKPGLECSAESGTCVQAGDFRAAPDATNGPDLPDPDTFQPDTSEPDLIDTAEPDLAACLEGEERACGLPVGECTVGIERCVNGEWTECDGLGPSEDVCDGLDNDCDGTIDGVAGTVLTQECGSAVGACVPGIQSCTAGDWGPCKDAVGPQPESCDGRDNDCNGLDDDNATDATAWFRDADSDMSGDAMDTLAACEQPEGYVADNLDCDDQNDQINPAAAEVCDEVDNNCDGSIDEGMAAPPTWYFDDDMDGFGDPAQPIVSCQQPPGYVVDSTDCDDTLPTVNPNATEVCDLVDNNCNGFVDEGMAAPPTWYADADSDNFGNAAISQTSCNQPLGFVADSSDCDDRYDFVNPSAAEVCDTHDNNCNGFVDEGNAAPSIFYADTDSDNFGDPDVTITACAAPMGYVADNTDCDDDLPAINPAATEVCDGVDNNCNGFDDEGAAAPKTFYRDSDMDLFGDPLVTVVACTAPAGYVADQTDCNDNFADMKPGGTEVCDGRDNNCNNLTDEGAAAPSTFYADTDMDTFGDPGDFVVACTVPMGYVADSNDCDDDVPAINPNATEVCDNVDNDCDTFVDEGMAAPSTFYADTDTDNYGDPANFVVACTQPAGYVTDATDCNDGVPTINPGATEICDTIDNDCDTLTDEGVLITYYRDVDADNYGDVGQTTLGCTPPAGYVVDSTDCDDDEPLANPGRTEVCDLIDNDCDSLTDEGVLITYYADTDVDLHGDPAVSVQACTAPVGYVADNTDCNDSVAAMNPAETEVCDLIDNDCDTLTDEGVELSWYRDADMDNYGNPSLVAQACTAPAGFVADNTDCNDAFDTAHPGRAEVCDGIDNDCDTLTDEGVLITYYRDADSDMYGNLAITAQACTAPMGFVADNTDCDDTLNIVNPAASEVCDGLDNNCNTQTDEGVLITYYRDFDSDNRGDINVTVQACVAPPGYVANTDDCNDTNNTIYLGATELCDTLDNDCDMIVDEDTADITFYRDSDSDGYGDPNVTIVDCAQPAGYVINNTDCQDGVPTINPAATEVCDMIDNDCDTLTDEGVQTTYYLDSDSDTFGDPATTVMACSQPAGHVLNSTDCDDDVTAINPSATEVCDLVDNDCDSLTDEGVQLTFYADADSDNYGNPAVTIQACTPPMGYVADNTDCRDDVAIMNPGETEVCDGLDNDCDGPADEGVLITYYRDNDDDNFGNPALTIQGCTPPMGYVADNTDCNDLFDTDYPGATEVCDSRDNDCDTLTDEGVTTTYYRDRDDDTYGNTNQSQQACSQPAGWVTDNTDCDDNDGLNFPTNTEVCDGGDNDCDTLVDEGVLITYYRDADDDNYGNTAVSQQACTAPVGYVTDNTDCDDGDGDNFPSNPEVCDNADNDCDTVADNGVTITYYRDFDSDTYGDNAVTIEACSLPMGYVTNSTDCDDADGANYPTNTEVCDGGDNDCDTLVDEGVTNTYYRDADTDNYGDINVTTEACTAPGGFVSNNTDCDDTDGNNFPTNPEVCDGADNDCDTIADEGVTTTYYRDADIDGYGDAGNSIAACSLPGGYVTNSTDCDDGDGNNYPTNTEVCDGSDNDCDTLTDEGLLTTYYQDADNDTYGNSLVSQNACTQPAGYVTSSTDCNDGVMAINPGATEVCDGIDNNCNSQTDEGLLTTYYRDLDGDSHGDLAVSQDACSQPAGYVLSSDDCNDNNAANYPGNTEVCDGQDNDCDSLSDEGVTNTYYRDSDSDMYGDNSITIAACSAPGGYVVDNTDCDDTRATVNPGQTEVCDNLDNDCDGSIDEGVKNTYYRDLDGDTFGNAASTVLACSVPGGYSTDTTDCDDTRSDVYPMAPELCDGVDNDCDGDIDEGCPACDNMVDVDFDGSNECDDCDDTNGSVYPGASEVCDGIDNDCDGLIDEDFDADGDMFSICAIDPLLFDCDDTDPNVNPGMGELCGNDGTGNGIDDNCNGYIDEGCNPCDPTDTDGDGVSECDGDCQPSDGDVYPGATEVCDGADNDCNIYTVDNCEVSDTCNFDGDGDPANDPDQCREDLLCACAVDRSGSCSGDYLCTAFCNTSETGPLGDGCASDQTCFYDLLRSANIHGCAVATDTPGTRQGGETCSNDADCRSNNCDKLCVGQGCNQEYCTDYCGSDDYCTGTDTICRVQRTASQIDGRCWPDTGPFLGSSTVGSFCTSDSQCDHGFCQQSRSICTEACCKDSDCGSGYTCSLDGDVIDTSFVVRNPAGISCSLSSDCDGDQVCYMSECYFRLVETSPQCVPDEAGQGTRQAGAACSSNDECRSNFCDATLNVCIESCCSDTACPTGTTCEMQTVEAADNKVTSARICVNLSTDEIFLRQ